MSYNIRHLDNVTLENKLYLFDSNLWLKMLKPPLNPSGRDKKYLQFFGKFKGNKVDAKIALSSLILSEVVNRYMREYGMKRYISKSSEAKSLFDSNTAGFYKEHYRKSEDFSKRYNTLCSDILSYKDFYLQISDNFGQEVSDESIISNPPVGLDFNDNYYVQLSKAMNYSIITDDADFFIKNVEILTYNDKLYQKSKDSIVATAK